MAFGSPPEVTTLVAGLEYHAEADADVVAIHWPKSNSTTTYAELADVVRRVAAELVANGARPGDRVLIDLPTGLDWIAAFFGCQWIGAAPVAIPPGAQQVMARIKKACDASLVVDRPLSLHVDPIERPANTDPDSIAFLQFTSGSTAVPKGVAIRHRAAVTNVRVIADELQLDDQDVMCGWLPLFHDMGLIGQLLIPILWRVPTVLLAPTTFVMQPRIWLDVLSRYGATITAAPNFAYELVARRAKSKWLDSIDLSCWRVALFGAEPVRASTVRRFLEVFSQSGLRPSTIHPVYGMAESCLAVTFPPLGRGVKIVASENGESVGVGRPFVGHDLEIRDADGQPVDGDGEGRIFIRGPSMMAGYWPDVTGRTVEDWFDTGDLGRVIDGELFVTGRVKELIVKAGRNIYPQEVETYASEVDAVRFGRAVAFGVADDDKGTEDLIVLVEAKRADDVEKQVSRAIGSQLGVVPDEVLVVPKGSIERTSSGKLRRLHMRQLYLKRLLQTLR